MGSLKMSESIDFTTFYNPNFPELLIIREDDLQVLVDTLEAHGFVVTNRKELSPDYFEGQPGGE